MSVIGKCRGSYRRSLANISFKNMEDCLKAQKKIIGKIEKRLENIKEYLENVEK